jgi:hypothetical protein
VFVFVWGFLYQYTKHDDDDDSCPFVQCLMAQFKLVPVSRTSMVTL